MREQVIEDAIVAHAEATGWFSRKMTYAGRKGCRDRDFYGHGQVVMVEMKRPGGVLSPHQVRENARMEAAGLRIYVIDSIDAGVALLDRLAARC